MRPIDYEDRQSLRGPVARVTPAERERIEDWRHGIGQPNCPVCGAPEGELCINFDPSKKGRRSTRKLSTPHDGRNPDLPRIGP